MTMTCVVLKNVPLIKIIKLQWRDEMWDKFSLTFDLVDRGQTHALRRRLGMDANPWRSFSRIIASYHYLRQEDVLNQFLAACRTSEGSPHCRAHGTLWGSKDDAEATV
jgi:hypothetical protein